MAVLSYVWHDPLLLSLVILNVVPLIILYVVKQFRTSDSNIRRLTKVHPFTPQEATYWKVFDSTKPQSGHPIIFISNHAPVAAQNPDQPASLNVVSNKHADASADENIASSTGSRGLEQVTSGRASMTAAGRKALLARLRLDKEGLDRTLSPNTPFDWNTDSPITPASPAMKNPLWK